MTTVRITVSLPEDVAGPLKDLPADQLSAYVTEALRRRPAVERARAALTAGPGVADGSGAPGVAEAHRTFHLDPAAAAALRERLRVPNEVCTDVVARLKADGVLPAEWLPRQ